MPVDRSSAAAVDRRGMAARNAAVELDLELRWREDVRPSGNYGERCGTVVERCSPLETRGSIHGRLH